MPDLENAAASLVLANSDETAKALGQAGVKPELLRLFPNPAPAEFADDLTRGRAALERVVTISNHLPEEVRQLLQGLTDEHGIVTEHWGIGGHPRRVTPAALSEASAVITIGKTVQYCLLAGIPVFCYDHFGGPGWLSADCFEAAALRNFSGRGPWGRRSGETLLCEFLRGYEDAARFALFLPDQVRSQYNLATHLDGLLDPAWAEPERCAARGRLVERQAGSVWAYRQLARVIARESAGRQEAALLAEHLSASLQQAQHAAAEEVQSLQQIVGRQTQEASAYAESLRHALAAKEEELIRVRHERERQAQEAADYAESLRQTLAANDEELNRLRHEYERQSQEASAYAESLRQALAAKDEELIRVRHEHERQSQEAAAYAESLRQALADKEEELSRLHDDAARLTHEATEYADSLRAELDRLQLEHGGLHRELSAAKAEGDRLTQALADHFAARVVVEGVLAQYRNDSAIQLIARLRRIDRNIRAG
jgi:hypothetical protein